MVSSTQGSHTDATRGEIYSQQSSFFSPAAGSNAREHVGYNSSRPVEYGQNDACINHQASQQRQHLMPGTVPFAQRPAHPEAPPQQIPNHFSYPNSVMQHQYPPYSLPVFPDGPRRYSTDEQWRMPVNDFTSDLPCGGWNTGGQSFSGQPYSHEGMDYVFVQSTIMVNESLSPSFIHKIVYTHCLVSFVLKCFAVTCNV